MSSTRSVISPGVFALSATTVIPPTPLQGVAYRNAVLAIPGGANGGWPYAVKVNSADYNQIMYSYSTLLDSLDKRGTLGYTNLIDYTPGALVLGSDNLLYTCTLANGPATALQDPVAAPAYWQGVTAQAAVQGAASNFKASSTGLNAIVTVSADELVLGDGNGRYVTERGMAATVNMAAVGAGGLDTGVLAISTWYSVWRIWKTDGTKSTVATLAANAAPLMPAGYTIKARLCSIYTDATANKYPLRFMQYGKIARCVPAAATNLAILRVIANTGGAIGVPGTTLVAVPTAAYVPPTAVEIYLNYRAPAGVEIQFSSSIVAAAGYQGSSDALTSPSSAYRQASLPLESTNVYWASTGAATAYIAGWLDS